MASKNWIFCLFFLCGALHAEKKALVIILAETRGAEITYENFKENVLDVLDADLAVCIGVKEGYCYDNPFYKSAKYRFLYDEPTDFATAFDFASDTLAKENPSALIFPWREFLKIKDQFLGGILDPVDEHPGSAGILLFFRWFLLQNLLKENLLEKYDFFVITRSDYLYKLPHPSTRCFSSEFLYIPRGERYGGVTDRHVVLPKQFVRPYLDILSKMVLNGSNYYKKMKRYSNWNLEQLILFHLKENHLAELVKFFPYVMYTVRPIGGTTRWSAGVFSHEHNFYIKYLSEYEAASNHLADFQKGKDNIDSFYKKRIHLMQKKTRKGHRKSARS